MSLGMDDRDGFIWLDGKLVPGATAAARADPCPASLGRLQGERIYDAASSAWPPQASA